MFGLAAAKPVLSLTAPQSWQGIESISWQLKLDIGNAPDRFSEAALLLFRIMPYLPLVHLIPWLGSSLSGGGMNSMHISTTSWEQINHDTF
jgi:hypothetical protein